jgi:hypothetical protein
MSFLSQAKKPAAKPKPPIITVIGSPGSGKTSFAGTFPNAIFIQAEDASTVFESWDESVQPMMFPVLPKSTKTVSTFDTLISQLRELATTDHDFKTVVVDSITALNLRIEHELCLQDDVATIADAAGGYHKGYTKSASKHADFMAACEILRNRKGMAVVLLGHSGVQKIKNSPDQGSEYTIHSLDMHKDSASVYINNSDAVIYIKKEEMITGAETNKKGQTTKFGRAMQTGERVLITSGDGLLGYVSAKSRYPTPSEIPLPIGTNPLLAYIAFYNQGAPAAPEAPEKQQEEVTQTDTLTSDVKESL